VEQLVWRLENGELPTAQQPKVVVVQIGTNGVHAPALAPAIPAACVHALQHPLDR
jgi:hypothetical protein